MAQQLIGYRELMAVRKSTTNGHYGATLDCWVVPSKETMGGLGVYLHNDGCIYNCLSRSSSGGGTNYDTTAEFTCAGDAYDAAIEYSLKYGFVYPFALSGDECYNLDGSSTTKNKSIVMEFK